VGRLERWHPGYGVALEGAPEEEFPSRSYRHENGQALIDPTLLSEKGRRRLEWICQLLILTQARPPNLACHGLHEWAMVYQGGDIRHRESAPLRLSQKEIDEVVVDHPICCSHFDAFRYKSSPWISSEILKEALFFAIAAREIDMRASPYDLAEYGYEPICIETPEGRREYEKAQHALYRKGLPLRAKLIESLTQLLSHAHS